MRTALVITLLFALALPAISGEVTFDNWLTTDPALLPFAVFDEDVEASAVEKALACPPVDPFGFWPEKGSELGLTPSGTVAFGSGALSFSPLPEGDGAAVALAALYLKSPAWQKGTLTVRGGAPFKLFYDGEELLGRTAAAADSSEESGEVTLDQGHHRLLLVTAASGSDSLASWTFQVKYEQAEETPEAWLPRGCLNPRHPFDITDYYLQEDASLAISPNGRWLAVKPNWWDEKREKKEDSFKLYDMKTREMVFYYVSEKGVGSMVWGPDSQRLLLTMAGNEGTDLVLLHTEGLRFEVVAQDLEKSGGWTWAPDGEGLYYKKTLSHEEGDEPYKVMWSLQDRWSGWRDKQEIRYFSLRGGTHITLTAGRYDPGSMALTPDGETLLVTRSVPQAERPFSLTELWAIDTATGAAEKVYSERFQSWTGLAISPDGRKVAFGAPRHPVTGNENEYPALNYYDRALYILDLASGQAELVDPEFAPAVNIRYYGTGYSNGGGFLWRKDGTLVFPALHNKKAWLCTYRLGDDRILKRQLDTPGFSQLTVSVDGDNFTLAYLGDQVNERSDVWWFDVKRGRGDRLLRLNEEFRRLTKGAQRVEEYDVTYYDDRVEREITVPGYLYYPRGYDEEGDYPLIVDTYGGVIGYGDGWVWGSVVYANRGYFCYIPVPRGAAGYGSDYADAHPNDWGEKTSRDMNTGVRHIVENVPGVDGERVGFVSGSYGGFLAMYLLAMPQDHPDYYPYATAISDYGISNLASYWGVGWWGYLYSDMASAGSFPWNRPQWYIEHSPLFQADNITAPLLLIHGDSDVNVPVGESDQMYTALKVLDREVTFVRFPGEGHGITGKRSSYLTSKRMHLEWFDKYLRDRPGAWDARVEKEAK